MRTVLLPIAALGLLGCERTDASGDDPTWTTDTASDSDDTLGSDDAPSTADTPSADATEAPQDTAPTLDDGAPGDSGQVSEPTDAEDRADDTRSHDALRGLDSVPSTDALPPDLEDVAEDTAFVPDDATPGMDTSAPPDATLATPTISVAPTRVSAGVGQSLGLGSSSQADLAWSAPGAAAISIVVETAGHAMTRLAEGASGTLQLTGLRSDASYAVRVSSCADVACHDTGPTVEAALETPEEVWQLVGSGEALSGLSTVASDGQAKIWAHVAGPEAGADLSGRVVLYYGTVMRPPDVVGQTLGVATGVRPLAADDPGSWLPLTTHLGSAGLVSPQPRGTPVGDVMTGQGVPLRSGGVRLYFESNGADGRTRILSVASADGFVGKDFNTSATSSLCRTSADYAAGGGCEARLEVEAAASPAPGKVPRVQNVRQFKIGFPTRDDWRWDGAAGAFMFVTLDRGGACNYIGFANQGYLVWSGTAWNAVLRPDGCPAALEDAQAPAPVHLGGGRYKLYHGTPGDRTGQGTSTLPFLGPKRVRYADGALTGDPARVDFGDWETTPHETRWLWPSGRQLNATEEGFIDDFVFLAPTDAFQIAYVVITDGSVMPRPAVAILRNP